jgi:uncharacterized membrane protein HdeD (DUF308 family)
MENVFNGFKKYGQTRQGKLVLRLLTILTIALMALSVYVELDRSKLYGGFNIYGVLAGPVYACYGLFIFLFRDRLNKRKWNVVLWVALLGFLGVLIFFHKMIGSIPISFLVLIIMVLSLPIIAYLPIGDEVVAEK